MNDSAIFINTNQRGNTMNTPTTLAEIETLQAGPELDALVAQHVMGWTINWDCKRGPIEAYEGTEPSGAPRTVPPFSTDSAFSDAVIHRIREERDGHFTLLAFTGGWKALGRTPEGYGDFVLDFLQYNRLKAAETPALAICRCGLRVFLLNDLGPTEGEMEEVQKEFDRIMSRAA